METKEEAAIEYGIKESESLPYLNDDLIRAFLAGVEFAQRWIPVEEELPEDGAKVIVKSERSKYSKGAYYLSWYSRKTSFSSRANITHWRYIELK